jgi:DNA-binding Lrp family transcriptional regulator
VIRLDVIDKQLWIELGKNCRCSYRYLADRLGISANAVKQRVSKLLETGVIQKWYLSFRPAMIDAQLAFIEVKTDGSRSEEQLTKALGNHPMIYVLLPLTTGDFVLHAEYIGSSSLLELTSFIRSIAGVTDAKIHPTTTSVGRKMELKALHLRVLEHLVNDPRASITDLARATGLTARRAKKIVEELIESDSLDFTFVWNPNAGESIAFISKIRYDSKVTQAEVLDIGIREQYPLEYFYSHISAIEPVVFSVFMADHLFDIQSITRWLRELSGVKSLSTMIYYSATVLDPPSRTRLLEMVGERRSA